MTKRIIKNFSIIMTFMIVLMLGTVISFAASVNSGTAKINTPGDYGNVRAKAKLSSDVVMTLKDNTKVVVKSIVFDSKTSTAKTHKWYKISANGKTGYVRADIVDGQKYSAVDAKVTKGVTYRKGAGTNMTKVGTLKKGTKVKVYLKATPVSSTKGSSKIWYMIKVGSKKYYACSVYFKLIDNPEPTPTPTPDPEPEPQTDEEYVNSLVKEGFPSDYAVALLALHKKHAKWQFKPLITNLKWSTVLTAENKSSKSKILTGGKWVAASKEQIAYYLDPRNFLTEKAVFMFENLSYNADTQKQSTVEKVLTSYLTQNGFKASLFVNAGEKYGISPVHLASRARQETGGSNGAAINGEPYTPSKDQEPMSVYNPFNIGANGNVYDGLNYAYEHGWTTPKIAIEEGAKMIANGYINAGQNTLYLEKFDLVNTIADHQYMANIVAPYQESISTYDSYSGAKAINETFSFVIPVYKSMPSTPASLK